MRLNEAGRLVLGHARVMLAEERRLYDDLDTMARRTRTVRVASIAPAPTWRLSSLILGQQPTTILEPAIVSQNEAESRLINRACDFAVTIREPRFPGVRSILLMNEDLYANVPANHPLRNRESVTFADLDGETFLLYEQIGFWMDVHRSNLPNSSFVIQPDRTIFLQQAKTSDLMTFTTNAPENTSGHPSRVAIPITDADAHAPYYLCMREDAPDRIGDLFGLIQREVRFEASLCDEPE